jgi:hypothetical protein
MYCKPTIIGVADATHYLVGATDSQNDFVILPGLRSIAVCNSLSSAKQLLRDHNINIVELTLETAYDEMCGLPSDSIATQTLYL